MKFDAKNLECGKAYDLTDVKVEEKLTVIETAEVAINNLVTDGEVVVKAENVTLKGCKASAITLCGAKNTLVANCEADTIALSDCYNCAVILNSACSITVQNNVNVYVIDNKASGDISFTDNNYIIANGNTFGSLCDKDNENKNGDNITDINFRPEFGANEDIIPHTNKELFVGMPRRKTVVGTELTALQYISEGAKAGDVIIVPPGAYEIWERMSLSN